MLAQSRLDDIIDGAVRDEISNRYMSEIIRSSDREMETYESDIENNTTEDFIHAGAREKITKSIKNRKNPVTKVSNMVKNLRKKLS